MIIINKCVVITDIVNVLWKNSILQNVCLHLIYHYKNTSTGQLANAREVSLLVKTYLNIYYILYVCLFTNKPSHSQPVSVHCLSKMSVEEYNHIMCHFNVFLCPMMHLSKFYFVYCKLVFVFFFSEDNWITLFMSLHVF